MAQYPKPSSTSGTFNNTSFNNNQSGGLTIAEGLKYFVSYPKTQSPSTITANNFTTTGNLDVAGDSQFGGNATFIGGATITGPLVFENDVEVGGTTTLDGTLLCLQTATIDGELTITNNVILEPNASTPTVAPYLELTNGVAGEYCQLYLDPQVGYDMTLYTNQTNGGGLTVRGANGASYTLNPKTITTGVVGAQTLNPIDMNNYALYGLNNVYSYGTGMTFIDSANAPMLQLTNGGHTSYENINMNTNNISNANTISSTFYNVGLYGTIAVNPSLNPTVLSISNSSTASSASIYFQMFNSSGVASSPLNMSVSSVNCTVGLNMNNKNISGINTISGNGPTPITCTSDIDMGQFGNIYGIDGGTNTIGYFDIINSTATTPSPGDNSTKIATTAFVQNACPIYTTTTATNTFGGSIMTPTSLDITTIQDNGYITFTSTEFNIQLTQTQNTLAYITFNTKPWPSFPPPAQNYYITGLCTSVQGLASVLVVNFSGTGPYYMSVYLQTGSLNTAGTFYTINLGTMQAFKT